MARVSIYLNFQGDTEAAFGFYRSVFGGAFAAFRRMGEIPAAPGDPPLPEAERELVMHVALPILGGTVLMGTDVLASMGHRVERGNAVWINLEPDDVAEAERLFAALSDGGTVVEPLRRMFWGDVWGSCVDRFGVRWMVNCAESQDS